MEHGWGGGSHLPVTLREKCRRKLWRREFLSVGARWGTWGDCRLGILEIAGGLRKGSTPCVGALLGWPLLGIRKDMGMEGSGTGTSLFAGAVRGLLLGIRKYTRRRAQ